MGVNKVWSLHFDMGKVHNTFRLALRELNIYNDQKFYGGKGIVLLDKAIHEYWLNKFIFNIMHFIAIPI